MPAPDQDERERALDVDRSVIVQAPAGSGKTTLLVQRYLRLLGLAERPEEILAITFTRKAAAEMHERVMAALRLEVPEARAALLRDRELDWRLTLQPHRLKIQTIDSFASALVHQLPLAAEYRPGAELVEDAADAYRQAVDRLYERLHGNDPFSDELTAVLELFGNDYATTRKLLAGMLARRDQWLDPVLGVVHLGRRDSADVRELVETGTDRLSARIIAELDDRMTAADRDTLERGMLHAAGHLGMDLTSRGDAYRLAARLFVTGRGMLRRRLTREQGFPASEPGPRAEMTDLLERLADEGAAPFFDNVRMLPAAPMDTAGAAALTSLCMTLLLAVGELDAVLQAQGRADFTQLVLAAARALSDGEAPTELALALDHRIRHVLVDEFQDTSDAQFRLFSLLLQGWSPGDGNTFFAVGDPMQSIYRFRDADVRVFFDAWHRGIADIPLDRVRLSANFRARTELVEWYNATFPAVMGGTDDPVLGRVAFSAATAARRPETPVGTDRGGAGFAGDRGTPAIQRTLLPVGADQTGAVVSRLQALLASDAEARLALLVRSRAHLAGLLPALREAGIHWRATDIDPLAERPVVQDLVSLARALADPADRLAWFSVLRAPWVGLDLPDLEVFAATRRLRDALEAPGTIVQLSDDGRRRVERLVDALGRAQHLQGEVPPRALVETVWLLCGGADACADERALDDAGRLLALMDDLGAEADDPAVLTAAVGRLFAEDTGSARLEIMTIHKAKGLEFDHVILPFLDRSTRQSEPSMLLWRRADDGLLLGARQSDDLYRWLAREERVRDAHERERLLYVACTRARESLHLFAEVDEQPPADSLLALLWPALEADRPVPMRQVAEHTPAYPVNDDVFRRVTSPQRLPADYVWRPPLTDYPRAAPALAPAPAVEAPVREPQVALGILMHQVLHDLSLVPLPEDPAEFCRQRHDRWRGMLADIGVESNRQEDVLAGITQQLHATLSDADGRWILEARAGAHAELELSGVDQEGIRHVFIDRTFVDAGGVRWLIDYKTGAPPPGADVDRFIAIETSRHTGQLEHHAALAREVFAEPLRLALYFTALPRLHALSRAGTASDR